MRATPPSTALASSPRPENATVRVRVADPIGTEMRELGMMTVVMEAGTGGAAGGASGDGEIGAIALGTLLCSVQIASWMGTWCLPSEAEEKEARRYHELIEEEEEKEREAARREAAEAPPSPRASMSGEDFEIISLRHWALMQKQQRVHALVTPQPKAPPPGSC